VAVGLSAPLAICALVLGLAGLFKLRTPEAAAAALGAPRLAIRVFSVLEIGLCAYALAAGGRVSAGAMTLLYTAFAGLSLRLAAQGEACGCFGSRTPAASPLQALLSAALAALCGAALVAGSPGVSGFLHGPPVAAAICALGVLAAVYGVVLAYTELPAQWGAWSPS
jgi:hypothetical protein